MKLNFLFGVTAIASLFFPSALSAQEVPQKQAPIPSLQSRAESEASYQAGETLVRRQNPENSPTLRLAQTYASSNPEKAIVKLKVEKLNFVYAGCTYTLLVDKDVDLSSYIGSYGVLPTNDLPTLYSGAEYTVPANATVSTNGVAQDEADSAFIDPGTYHAMVLYPYQGYTGLSYYVPQSDVFPSGYACLTDFEFLAGYTYVFVVGDDSNASGNGDGSFQGPVDLELADLEIPSSCGTSSVQPTIRIRNAQVAQAQVEVCFTVGTQGDTVRESLPEGLASDAEVSYTFTQPLPVLKGKYNTITAWVEAVDGEFSTVNNKRSARLFPHDPVQAPYVFSVDTGVYFYTSGAWSLSYMNGHVGGVQKGEPLYTRCIEMLGGRTYRFSFSAKAGVDYGWAQEFDKWCLLFGRSDDALADMDTLHHDTRAMYVKQNFEFEVTPEEDGVYTFVFNTESTPAGLAFSEMELEMMADIRLDIISMATGMPTVSPLEHLPATGTAKFQVANRGLDSVKGAQLVFLAKSLKADTCQVPGLKPGDTVTLEIPFVFGQDITENSEVFSAKALYGSDVLDTRSDTTVFSTDVLAYDHIEPFMFNSTQHEILSMTPFEIGLPFHLGERDTVTGISLGMRYYGSTIKMKISLYEYDEESMRVGKVLYSTETTSFDSSGFHTYEIPARVLDSGSYFASVYLGYTGIVYGLVADFNPSGYYHLVFGERTNRYYNLGTPAIRLVCGHDSRPLACDLAFDNKLKAPLYQEALFSANEPVTVQVSNLGFDSVAGVPVALYINGEKVGDTTVDLDSYSSADVSFVADLSQTEKEYEMVFVLDFEKDANPANDTLAVTLKTPALLDPYVLDFEGCPDFALTNFNPTWTSVNRDNSTLSYMFSGFSFPHSGEAFGFITFNPSATTPPMVDEYGSVMEEVAPYQGKKYGATFANPSSNDDWLISPKLQVANKGKMEFQVRSFVSDTSHPEKYNVLLSSKGNNPDDFSVIYSGVAGEEWEKVTVDLSDYAGKSVYLAIQNISENSFVFMVDAISITKPTSAGGDDIQTQVLLYPNPAQSKIEISSSSVSLRKVRIYSMNGHEIYVSGQLDTRSFRYDVSRLSSGIYVAVVETEAGHVLLKFSVL